MVTWVVQRWGWTRVCCWRHRSCSGRNRGAKSRRHRPSSVHKTTHWPCPQPPKGPTGRTCHPRPPSSLALTDFKALKRAVRSTPEGKSGIGAEEWGTHYELFRKHRDFGCWLFFFYKRHAHFLIHNYGPAIQHIHMVCVWMYLNACPNID